MDTEHIISEFSPEAVSSPDVLHIHQKRSKRVWLLLFLVITVCIATFLVLKENQQNSAKHAQYQILSPTHIPQPTPTMSKASINDKVFSAFSLTVPQGWFRTAEGNTIQYHNYDVHKAEGRGFDPIKDKGKLKIEIYSEQTDKSLEEYIESKNQNEMYVPNRGEWKETATTVGGQPAIKLKNNASGFVYYVKDPTNTTILSISFLLDFINYIPLGNQIISTFVFVKEVDSSNWKSYYNNTYHYILKYPEKFSLSETTNGVWIDDQIWVNVIPANTPPCRGDCPVDETSEETFVGNNKATKIEGYTGSMDGIPQRFERIEIPHDKYVYILKISALKNNNNEPFSDDSIRKISQKDTDMFQQILSTFSFTQ